MATPVSWFLIEAGWRVVAADGSELGRVEEVTGDQEADVFDGIVVRGRYVPSELVGEIVEGTVQLNVDPDVFAHLHEAEPGLVRRTLRRITRRR